MNSFIKERLTERSKLIDDSILRKNLPLWKPGSKSSKSKEKMKLKSVKNGLPAVLEAIHRMSK